MAGTVAKGGKKNRKYGRNEAGAKRYAAENRLARNKKRKLLHHLTLQPNDKQAAIALVA